MYIPILNKLAMSNMYAKLAFGIDVANGYRYAHEKVLQLLKETHLTNDDGLIDEVEYLLRVEMESAQNTLYDMYNIFPEIYVSISSRHSARMLLHNQRGAIHEMLHQGLIGSEEACEWTAHMETQMKHLVRMPSLIHLPSKNDILKEIPWIKSLNAKVSVFDSSHLILHIL